MYYRLGLYKIDRLCSNETANLLKVNPTLGQKLTVECIDTIRYSVGSINLRDHTFIAKNERI